MAELALPDKIIVKLQARRETLATAESCTGGLLGHQLTGVAGASAVYLGGVIAYSNPVKASLLGISEASLNTQGAVSEIVAGEMALGVRERLGADWGIGITGIAGPGGGTIEKPVGLVYIGVAGANSVQVRRHVFSGNRDEIKLQSAQCALKLLLEVLE